MFIIYLRKGGKQCYFLKIQLIENSINNNKIYVKVYRENRDWLDADIHSILHNITIHE